MPPSFAPAPQFRGHPWFFANITHISDSFGLPNFRKVGKFSASIERKKPKVLQLQGAKLPLPPDQGLCLWSPLGAPSSDLHHRLALPRSPWGRASSRYCGLEPPLGSSVGDWNSRVYSCDRWVSNCLKLTTEPRAMISNAIIGPSSTCR